MTTEHDFDGHGGCAPGCRQCRIEEQAATIARLEGERDELKKQPRLDTLATIESLRHALAAERTAREQAEQEAEKWRGAASVLCGAHVGVPQAMCPVCRAEQAEFARDAFAEDIVGVRKAYDDLKLLYAACLSEIEKAKLEIGTLLMERSRAARRAEQAEAERDALTARVAKLREWMAEYPNDKYTGTWWLAEFDRICKEQP